MDARSWLPIGTVLPFPGMECRIKGHIGRGSNALVYLGEYEDRSSLGQYHEVLIKELFPLHPRGAIHRNSDNGIHIDSTAKELYQIHKSSFERGNRIHLQLLKEAPAMVGGNVNTYALNETYYTVLGCSGSIGFDTAMQMDGLSLRKIVERLLYLLDALNVFHQAGLLHLDVSPDNVLVIPQAQREHILLIDYNSAGTCSEWQSGKAEYCSIKQGYTAPEICNGEYEKIGVHSDLYSVSAIFFTCLMGRQLTLEEIVRSTPPDAAESKYLTNAPETVRYMVKRILRRGLNTLPSRRYSSILVMQNDLQELLDRIDCRGVTHWALYENARKGLDNLVDNNPSLAFLRQQEELYPIHFCDSQTDSSLDLFGFLRKCFTDDVTIVLEASGGQGKTTALLHAAMQLNAKYTPRETVAVFISAYGYRPGEKWFVHDSILRMLKFKQETETYEAARHELDMLLSRTLEPDKLPVVLIILDGINEIACETALLIQEINELSKRAGTAIILSSRSDVQGLHSKKYSLHPLSDDEVTQTLSTRGILTPDSRQIRQLLRTPLMLSMFVRATEAAGHQIIISTDDGLIQSMLQMETQRYAEDQPEHWQMDVAIHYVLPAIAHEEIGSNGVLSDQQMLNVVARCYRTVRSRDLLRFYPRWIGRSKTILGGAQNDEEWYSIIVHELLWRRAGLLIRDENAGYRIFHQQIREWLNGLNRENQQRLIKRKASRAGIISAIVVVSCGIMWQTVWIPYIQPIIEQSKEVLYPKNEAREVVEGAQELCHFGKCSGDIMLKALDYTKSRDLLGFELWLPTAQQGLQEYAGHFPADYLTACNGLSSSVEDIQSENARMPWSDLTLRYDEYCDLASFPAEMAAQYMASLDVLNWLMHNEEMYDDYADEYVALLESLINNDMQIIYHYYEDLVRAELTAMQNEDHSVYNELTKRYSYEMDTPADSKTEAYLLRKFRNDDILPEVNNHDAVLGYQGKLF